jgi:predicted Kef-type K+ transport protein
MFSRLKRALVESYVGTIAVGWLLAQAILHFVNIFVAPVAGWIARNEYQDLAGHPSIRSSFSLQDAVPELARAVGMFAVVYILLRWLYYKPFAIDKTPNAEGAQ